MRLAHRRNGVARTIMATPLAVAIAWSFALPVVAAPPPSIGATKPRLSLVPAQGFYDDAWALDGTGRRLAVIHTDRESFQRLEIFQLDASPAGATTTGPPTGSGNGAPAVLAPTTVVELAPPTRAFHALVFPPGAAEPLLVSRGEGQEEDSFVFQSIDIAATAADNKGRLVVQGKAAPVSAFGFATLGVAPKSQVVLVVVARRPGRNGEMIHTVTPLGVPGLKPAGKPHSYLVAADGTLRPQGLITIGFFDGYAKLLGQKPGWYDKKKDVRQPDAMAVLDLLTGKLSAEGPIEDIYGWARTSRLRREHPNRTAFVQLADSVLAAPPGAAARPPESAVDLVDGLGRLAPLPLAVPFSLYDRSTLKDQEGPDPGVVHFGIQIDPVNAEAVRRQKADVPVLDVYTVPLDRPAGTRLRARAALGARPVSWFVAGSHLVVFRKFKSFARGGDRLDVYDLAP